MDDSRNWANDHHLGVNKMGKNIRKVAQSQPQALVYNINKSHFRTVVQQLTGSGSSSTAIPPPKPPNSRLVKVRPAPLTQIPTSTSVNPTPKPVPFSVSVVESPISAYIRYLTEPSPVQTQRQTPKQNPVQPVSGLLQSHQTNPTFLQSQASLSILSPPQTPFPHRSPNFAFSPRILGGGPLSPSSSSLFFPLLSPTWKPQ